MSLGVLNWLFRISGHSPSHRRSDKYIALVCICLIAVATNEPYNLSISVRDFGVNSLPQIGSTASILVCNFGSIVNANTRTVNFGSLTRKINLEPDVRDTIAIVTVYIYGCAINLFTALAAVDNVKSSFRRIVLFHFFIIPLCQQVLLVRSLKRAFSYLNNQLPNAFNRLSSTGTVSSAQVSSFINDYVHLRYTLQQVNSYFGFYSVFFVVFNLVYSINLLLNFLDAMGNLNSVKLYELAANFLFLTPVKLMWLYCHGDCAREVTVFISLT